MVNQTGGNKEGVAEHVMAMMLALSKRIVETDRFMRRAARHPRVAYMGDNVQGRTIGIVGLGNIGSRVAELCRGLFQMRVLAYDPYLTPRRSPPAAPKRLRSTSSCATPTTSRSTAPARRKRAA